MIKIFCYLRFSFLRLIRDPLSLGLTIFTPPFFTLFFWIVYNNSTTDVSLAVLNEDIGVETAQKRQYYGNQLILLLSDASNINEMVNLQLVSVESEKEARTMIKKGIVHGLISVPAEFSVKCAQKREAVWYFSLQKGILFYDAVKLLLDRCNIQFNSILIGNKLLVDIKSTDLKERTKFSIYDSFVPGLLTFAIIMLVFSVSGAVSREIESGAFIHLRMSSLTPVQMISGLSIVHFCAGIACVFVTLLTIKLTGFSFEGSFYGILILCSLTIISAISIGIIIASLARSRHKTLLASCIIMFLFVLFSGIMFPVPDIEVLRLGQNTVSLFDLLPTIHLHSGLTAMLFRKAEFTDISYEYYALIFLTILLSAAGKYSLKYFVYTDS